MLQVVVRHFKPIEAYKFRFLFVFTINDTILRVPSLTSVCVWIFKAIIQISYIMYDMIYNTLSNILYIAGILCIILHITCYIYLYVYIYIYYTLLYIYIYIYMYVIYMSYVSWYYDRLYCIWLYCIIFALTHNILWFAIL